MSNVEDPISLGISLNVFGLCEISKNWANKVSRKAVLCEVFGLPY